MTADAAVRYGYFVDEGAMMKLADARELATAG